MRLESRRDPFVTFSIRANPRELDRLTTFLANYATNVPGNGVGKTDVSELLTLITTPTDPDAVSVLARGDIDAAFTEFHAPRN